MPRPWQRTRTGCPRAPTGQVVSAAEHVADSPAAIKAAEPACTGARRTVTWTCSLETSRGDLELRIIVNIPAGVTEPCQAGQAIT